MGEGKTERGEQSRKRIYAHDRMIHEMISSCTISVDVYDVTIMFIYKRLFYSNAYSVYGE